MESYQIHGIAEAYNQVIENQLLNENNIPGFTPSAFKDFKQYPAVLNGKKGMVTGEQGARGRAFRVDPKDHDRAVKQTNLNKRFGPLGPAVGAATRALGLSDDYQPEYANESAAPTKRGPIHKGGLLGNPTPPRNPRPPISKPTPGGVGRVIKNSADLFDIIKGHLIDEGYVETEEAAIAIMANMSEEWRQSIISEVAGLIPLAGLAATAVKKVQDWGNSPSTGPDDRLRDAPKGMSPEERKKRSNTNPVTGRTNKPL